ncbi:MAG: hypothetical protein QXP60_02785 [Nitrososphaerota archaeon]
MITLGEKKTEEKRVRDYWKDSANLLLQFGDILIRIGIFATLVYGIYYAIKLFMMIVEGKPFILGSGQTFNMLIHSLITFVCMGIVSILAERRFSEKKFRHAGIIAVTMGAILLVTAPIAGLIILIGGFIVLLAMELKRPPITF